jgi:hypothetical protein
MVARRDLNRRTVTPTLQHGKEDEAVIYFIRPSRLLSAILIVAAAACLVGCGVVAAPVRVTSDVVKVVPGAGDVVAAPLDVTADTID